MTTTQGFAKGSSLPARTNPVSLSRSALAATSIRRAPGELAPGSARSQRGGLSPPAFDRVQAHYIYVVDDEPDMTDMYTFFLEESGHLVKAFNDRAEALATLKGESRKPDLLVVDYFGHPLPIERFMDLCPQVHPTLRILMASGFSESAKRLSSIKPDRFIQKPFTVVTFLREARAALAP